MSMSVGIMSDLSDDVGKISRQNFDTISTKFQECVIRERKISLFSEKG